MSARFYHAGLNKKDRIEVQQLWAKNTVKIIVATIAFGMGIDKPDVRYVIHYSLPKSLEGYYQETGRAGRDGLESVCILFYTYGDKRRVEYLIEVGDGSKEQKQSQKEYLAQVIQYCENKVDCRRQQLLGVKNNVICSILMRNSKRLLATRLATIAKERKRLNSQTFPAMLRMY